MTAPLFADTAILSPEAMDRHVEAFNRHDHTHLGQAVSNEAAADWMAANEPPLFPLLAVGRVRKG